MRTSKKPTASRLPTRGPWRVVDLFSGAGGMSYGFHSNPQFRIVGAVDAQRGKPSSGSGTLECNRTYAANVGLSPLEADLGSLPSNALSNHLTETQGSSVVDVLISCAPCTGFSRTIRRNLVEDDARNSLVSRSADFVEELQPRLFLMENVGELLAGKFSHHYTALRSRLEAAGYTVHGAVHRLEEFGLPQLRRRALILAVKKPLTLRTLEDLWSGYRVTPDAVTVRRAIGGLPAVDAGLAHPEDSWHVSPSYSAKGMQRLRLIPHDGGSWPDLLRHPEGSELLIPSMRHFADQGRVGPHPDVYGRLAWDKPSVTIKRECAHTGNGRYAHPQQDRLCTVREMGILQGFPKTYRFQAANLSNMYRHIGDAVPPIISYQLAGLCGWILSGRKPNLRDCLLPNTHLTADDLIPSREASQLLIAGL